MEKDIVIDGVKVHYNETGNEEGKPVIIMHGWGCNHTTVASIESLLSPGMKVYNIDLPGHGQSDEPPAVWGVDDFTRLVEKFIEILGLKDVSLVGHSFGGRISILMASRNRIWKVLLVDSAGIKPDRPLSYYIKVYSFKTAKVLLPIFLGKKRGQHIIDAWRGKAGSADYRQSSPMMRAVMSRCVNEDLKHVMPSISCPVLLVWGENDTATPLSDAKTMEKLIPDAGLVSFPGCGHYSFLDNPYGFRTVVTEFFKNELQK